MRLDANPDALAGDAAQLVDDQCAPSPRVCVAPGADPVSTSIAAQLTAHGASLEALIEHSGFLRSDGADVTRHTAFGFRQIDEANAASISGAAAAGTPVAPMVTTPIPSPALPEIPVIAPPAIMSGEVLSKALHEGGPGPGALREFASHWRSRADQLDQLAGRTESTGLAIDTDWDDDGLQQAGSNVRKHGQWLFEMACSARRLADTADEHAEHVQLALDTTPTPQDFAATRRAWHEAWAANLRAGGLLSAQVNAAAAAHADNHGRATEAEHVLFAAAATTSGDSPVLGDPAPTIATPLPPPDTTRDRIKLR